MSQDVPLKLVESGSSLGTFMDCPKKYEFVYIKKLSSQYYQKNLAYGSFIHALLENMWLTRIGMPATSSVEAAVEDQLTRFPEQGLEIRQDFALAVGVANEWKKYWDSRTGDLSNSVMQPISVEEEWVIPVEGRALALQVGKSDGIFKHLSYGKNFLYELKTSGSTDRESYKHKLELDKQINSNLLAARFRRLETEGVIYDIIWKPAIRRKVERKTMPDETVEEFNERILQEYRASPEKYFERVMVFRSQRDFADYAQDLRGQFAALRSVAERGHFYRNTNSCEKYGNLCPFFNACLTGSGEEEEGQFRVRENKFPELSHEFQIGVTRGTEHKIDSQPGQ